ncbi:hypothetical protein JCM10213_003449 [Rhodosporidiobolus nylandii]
MATSYYSGITYYPSLSLRTQARDLVLSPGPPRITRQLIKAYQANPPGYWLKQQREVEVRTAQCQSQLDELAERLARVGRTEEELRSLRAPMSGLKLQLGRLQLHAAGIAHVYKRFMEATAAAGVSEEATLRVLQTASSRLSLAEVTVDDVMAAQRVVIDPLGPEPSAAAAFSPPSSTLPLQLNTVPPPSYDSHFDFWSFADVEPTVVFPPPSYHSLHLEVFETLT